MLSLDKIQVENEEWVERNFPGKCDENTAFMGMVEELGELSHARLKAYQGIRNIDGFAEWDAMGDLLIYALYYCTTKGWSMFDVINQTWYEVKKRDWIKYPKNGRTE